MTKDPSPSNSIDKAHPPINAATVEQLKTQLGAIPEIRQQRVEALRQALAERSYQICPERIAAAMLAEAGQVEPY